MESAEIGTWLAMIIGFGSAAGFYLGGYLSDRFGQKDQRWYLWLPAITLLCSIPFALTAFFATGKITSLIFYIFPAFLGSTYLGPAIAMTHGIVGLRMRALASAVLFFILNIT